MNMPSHVQMITMVPVLMRNQGQEHSLVPVGCCCQRVLSSHAYQCSLFFLPIGDDAASDSQAGFTSLVDNVYQQSLALDATQSMADWQVCGRTHGLAVCC